MKKKKVNKKSELSSSELNSVAGGRYNDLVIQQMVNTDGFQKKWLDGAKNGQAFDKDFVDFLYQNYGLRRASDIAGRYGTQKDMFEKK